MPPITTTIEVDRPAEGVFAYVTNPSRYLEKRLDITCVHGLG